jgi:hypothetical protein
MIEMMFLNYSDGGSRPTVLYFSSQIGPKNQEATNQSRFRRVLEDGGCWAVDGM